MADAAELVSATSNIRARIRAIVVDQNLEGHMLGSEVAVFACKMLPRMNFVADLGSDTSSSRDRPIPAKAFLDAPVDGTVHAG